MGNTISYSIPIVSLLLVLSSANIEELFYEFRSSVNPIVAHAELSKDNSDKSLIIKGNQNGVQRLEEIALSFLNHMKSDYVSYGRVGLPERSTLRTVGKLEGLYFELSKSMKRITLLSSDIDTVTEGIRLLHVDLERQCFPVPKLYTLWTARDAEQVEVSNKGGVPFYDRDVPLFRAQTPQSGAPTKLEQLDASTVLGLKNVRHDLQSLPALQELRGGTLESYARYVQETK